MMLAKGHSWAVVLGRQTHAYVLCFNNTTAQPVARQTYGAARAVKNEATYYRKARRTGGPVKCKPCGHQFVQMRTYAPLANETKRRIELLLSERISLEGICRVEGIAPHQLYRYIDELYGEIPPDLACSVGQKADIDLVKVNCELDELWTGPPVRFCGLESQ